MLVIDALPVISLVLILFMLCLKLSYLSFNYLENAILSHNLQELLKVFVEVILNACVLAKIFWGSLKLESGNLMANIAVLIWLEVIALFSFSD